MGWDRIERVIAGLLTHPLVVLVLSLAVFLAVVWAVLPFALYGIRSRLDRILDALERIQGTLEKGNGPGAGGVAAGPPPAPPGGGEENA